MELRFELDRRFLSGEMGGHVGVDEPRRADARANRELARTIIGNSADLSPSTADPLVCERVSVGFAVEGVRVVRVP
ncbi:MAG: hypothetical protein H6720_02650 [Sandaracinus sp.]|nr:hypothetical protein [Sandaracinus sp.]